MQRSKVRRGGRKHLRLALYVAVVVSAVALFHSHGHVALRSRLTPQQQQADDGAAHQPRYLLDTAWSPDPVLGLIKTDLYLSNDVSVHVMPPKPDYDPLDGNIVDYLMLGLLEHPRVVLVDNKEEADVLFSITAWTNESATLGPEGEEMNKSPDWSKVIIVDETDNFDESHHVIYNDGQYLAYFKRSFVRKNYSEPGGIDRSSGQRDLPYSYWPNQHNFFGFAYGITDRYIRSLWDERSLLSYDDGSERTIPVLCTLRRYPRTDMGGRTNVIDWLQEMDIPGARVNHTDDHNRADTGPLYWRAMKAAKIIVTANPGNWEGDFRLWEALCSKALVLVDRMYVELPHPFVDGEDVVVFDSLDRGSLMKKVRYYMEHEAEARRIAMNGFYKAIRYHRYVNRVDYILNTVNLLTDPSYQNSAMRLKARMMHASTHFFTAPSERERGMANHTMAHIARALAQRPPAAVVDRLKQRLGAERPRWEAWIGEKKQPLPTEPPPSPS